MRHLMCISIALTIGCASTAFADPIAQTQPTTQEAADAHRRAEQPLDVPLILGLRVPVVSIEKADLIGALDGIRDFTPINFLVDWHALEPLGVERGTVVSVAGKNLTVGQVLEELLRPLAVKGVTCRVEKEAVFISTKDGLAALTAFRKRNAAVLAAGPLNPRVPFDQPDQVSRTAVALYNIPLNQVLEDLSKRTGVTFALITRH